ncbi:hypothetical protein PoB_006149900 [Plakobranchus ocellatus]|uniref:60S ribosomal protein L41 n=1 Tax=Plakobranchus ocellatus TaxID=259542 RepID=A0AAV4CSZ2_9GAST|nr:hypothetical protein PoB_006149900 [Plakobranchus ocellatus]
MFVLSTFHKNTSLAQPEFRYHSESINNITIAILMRTLAVRRKRRRIRKAKKTRDKRKAKTTWKRRNVEADYKDKKEKEKGKDRL